MEEQIKEIIETIRPYINMDGGDVEFIKYTDNYVYVRLSGACVSCNASNHTLEDVILTSIKSEIPEVEGIINLTDEIL